MFKKEFDYAKKQFFPHTFYANQRENIQWSLHLHRILANFLVYKTTEEIFNSVCIDPVYNHRGNIQ